MHFPKQKKPKNEKIIGLQRQVGQDILPKIPGWFKPIDECFHKRVIFLFLVRFATDRHRLSTLKVQPGAKFASLAKLMSLDPEIRGHEWL